jgi:hypothetical protein
VSGHGTSLPVLPSAERRLGAIMRCCPGARCVPTTIPRWPTSPTSDRRARRRSPPRGISRTSHPPSGRCAHRFGPFGSTPVRTAWSGR